MRKLVCTVCGAIWYTSNISDDQICCNCNGILEEVNDSPEND
jgi:hypothetical protein